MGRLTGAPAFSDPRFTPANGEGVPVPKGWSGRASVAIREQTTPLVNGQLRFTSFYGEGGDDGNRLLDASIELGSPWFAVHAGQVYTRHGPGRHCAPALPVVRVRPLPGDALRGRGKERGIPLAFQRLLRERQSARQQQFALRV